MNITEFNKLLYDKTALLKRTGELFYLQEGKTKISVQFFRNKCAVPEADLNIPMDLALTAPQKILGTVFSKIRKNKTVFARKCDMRRISKATAEEFLNNYHIMHSTSSAFKYGLFYKEELLAVAAFSKGRKMNRLSPDLRSYELIRFCSKEGITVTGGLSRLVKFFCAEKNPGDIMTYVDKQFSKGESFIKSGFEKSGETPPKYFLVDKSTFKRLPIEKDDEDYDKQKFYKVQNLGNIKLIYKPKFE